MPRQLLLTGASGFLGWNIIQAKPSSWSITGVVNKHTTDLPVDRIIQLDLSDTAAITRRLKQESPDAIIHTAAISDANYCQQHPEESYRINVDATAQLAMLAASLDIPFIFTSTDLVFDGTKGNYSEDDKTNPLSAYGKQKVAAVKVLLEEIYLNACVCRMPLMFGDPGPHSKSFVQPFLQNLQGGKSINLFTDEYRTAVDGLSAARGLWMAVEQQWEGIWHLGGPDKLSRYEFGVLLAEIFQINRPAINAIRQKDLQMAAPRPADVSLNSQKAFKAGWLPDSNRQALLMLNEVLKGV